MPDPANHSLDDAELVEQAWKEIRGRGALREGLETVRAVLGRTEDPALRARALHVLGHGQSRLRRPGRAIRTLLESAGIYADIGDDWKRAHVLDSLGQVYAAHGRLDAAMHHYSLSLVDKATLGDRKGLAVTIGNIGRIHLRAGRYQDAIQCFERDLAIARELGDIRGEARMFEDLGRAWSGLGDDERAETAFRAAAEMARAHDLTELVFYAHLDLALLCMRQNRVAEAERELDAARATGLDRGTPFFSLLLEAAQAELLLAQDDPGAMDALECALDRLSRSDLPDAEIPIRIRLAKALAASGLTALAERTLVKGLRRARRAGYARYVPALTEAMTALRLVEGALDETGPRRRGHTEDTGSGEPADGAYVTLELLGRGAYGEVYRAWDPLRGREVALKLVHLERVYEHKRRRRLIDSVRVELEAASRVRHPGVARVHAIGEEDDGGLYVVQELVEGTSLRSEMEASPEPEATVVSALGARIAHALQALHSAGVIHRDLKPGNVILRPDGAPVLVDFGIAHLEVDGAPRPEAAGTLEYMAPEQARGANIDGRADLYALGVIVFEWLVGFRPLQLADRDEATWREMLEKRVPPRVREFRPDVPEALDDLVASLLEKKPGRRPRDAAVVAEVFSGVVA